MREKYTNQLKPGDYSLKDLVNMTIKDRYLGELNFVPLTRVELGFIKESFTYGVPRVIPDVPEAIYSQFKGGLDSVNDFLMNNGTVGAKVGFQRAWVQMRHPEGEPHYPSPDHFSGVNIYPAEIIVTWKLGFEHYRRELLSSKLTINVPGEEIYWDKEHLCWYVLYDCTVEERDRIMGWDD